MPKVLLAQHIGRTNGLLQKSVVTGDVYGHVLQHVLSLSGDHRSIHDLHVAGSKLYNVTYYLHELEELAKALDLNLTDFLNRQRPQLDYGPKSPTLLETKELISDLLDRSSVKSISGGQSQQQKILTELDRVLEGKLPGFPSRNVDDNIRVSGSSADSNTRLKYGASREN
eukprot:s2459_g6.t1